MLCAVATTQELPHLRLAQVCMSDRDPALLSISPMKHVTDSMAEEQFCFPDLCNEANHEFAVLCEKANKEIEV